MFWMIVLLLAAFFVRIHHLNGTPPGISYDAASNLADALRIHQGIPLSWYLGTRPEPAYRFLLAGWYALAGTHLFTANLLQGFIGLSGVALAYRAGVTLLNRHPYRYVGGFIAGGALATSMSHVALSRITERGVLLPVVILAGVILLLRATRSRRIRPWFTAGMMTAAGVHTYLAGIAALPWLAGFVIHQLFFHKYEEFQRRSTLRPCDISPSNREGMRGRVRWRKLLALCAGAFVALMPWLLLIATVPTLFYRVTQASANVADLPLIERMLRGVPVVLEAFLRGNDPGMFYNLPYTPPLHLVFVALALMGLLPALWRIRHAGGALLVGGLLIFTVPALLSNDPQSTIRLTGATTLLCLLAGWGAVWLLEIAFLSISKVLSRIIPPRRPGEESARFLGISFAWAMLMSPIALLLLNTHLTYQAFWTTPAHYTDNPDTPSGIPYNYTLGLYEALEELTRVTVPTYVPLKSVNSALAYYVLQREAYPNVTTWSRYGLKELPAGQIFYPEYDYFHFIQSPQEPLQVLLLPQEKTLVILPPDGNKRIIARPEGDDVTVLMSPRYGWPIARIQPAAARSLPAQTLPEYIPVYGSGLELVNPPESFTLIPGKLIDTVLEWHIMSPQPADIASVLQVVDMQFNAIASDEYIVLEYLYPSARWQPGDIVPDLHAVLIPPDAPDTLYRWGTGAYVIPYQQPLLPVHKPPVLNHPGTLWLWGTGRISLSPSVTFPATMTVMSTDIRFANGVRLRGYTLYREATIWRLTLYWETDRIPEADMVIFVHALNADGTLIGQQDALPNNGQTPLWSWLPGTIVATQHEIAFSGVPVSLRVGMYNPLTQVRVGVTIDEMAAPDAAVLIEELE